MKINLTESNLNKKIIYYTEYSPEGDKTFIIKQVFEAAGPNPEQDGWIDVSEECVGWHWGSPNFEDDSKDFIGRMKATYGDHITDEFLQDTLQAFRDEGAIIKEE